jgi:FdhD protein
MALPSATPLGRRQLAVPVRVQVVREGTLTERPDDVVAEEPLEIRAGPPGAATTLGVTMRTPGHDFELAVGFLLSEGVLTHQGQVASVRYCETGGFEQRYNVVTVDTVGSLADTPGRRGFTVNASCGICGTATLEDLERRCPAVAGGPSIGAEVLCTLPDALSERQRVFSRTGGLHAAGLSDADGTMAAVREDVGRHNAVDKLVGWAAMAGRLPLSSSVLTVSGRVSFEIVQKAAVAGIPVVVAVSAPSSLAVDTARRLGITLAAFVRGHKANLYAHPERVHTGGDR